MFLQKINLLNFKSYETIDLIFSEKINCFVGENGVGKTNLLDAIYYLSFCKSYFNSADSQNIKIGTEFFLIQGQYFKSGDQLNISCSMKRNQKKNVKKNNKEYNKLSEHIGLLPIVMVSPNDSSLILEGSEERRKYIDSVISQYDNVFLEKLIKYNKALLQRNTLLKDFAAKHRVNKDLLEIWNEHLIEAGNYIFTKRKEFISLLKPVFHKYYDYVSMKKEHVEFKYTSQLEENKFSQLLQDSFQKDIALQYTSNGVHKDDLEFLIGTSPLKRSASQGQQKTFLVALKFAQFDFIKNRNNLKPIILLDDIFDKLDKSRVSQIVSLLAQNHFGQIFITDTSSDHLSTILRDIAIEHKIFTIGQ